MNCDGCGTEQGVELWRMGVYSMYLCEVCATSNSSFSDGFGNWPVKQVDIDRERFEEGLAEMVKILDRLGHDRPSRTPASTVAQLAEIFGNGSHD